MQRDFEYEQYQRVLKYAEDSSKLELNDDYCSKLLTVTSDSFHRAKFMMLFDEFDDFCPGQRARPSRSGGGAPVRPFGGAGGDQLGRSPAPSASGCPAPPRP